MNHKAWGVAAASATLLLTTACSGSNAAGGDETFHLRFASYNVPDAAEAKTTAQWAKDVAKATDGRVEVEFFYQESLLTGVETLPGVADGRADMGFIADAYYPGELPLTTVVGIPFVTSNPQAQGRAFIDLYQNNEALKAEWENQGVHVLTWAPVPPNIVAVEEPVDSLDDLAGRKIRGYGYVSQALEAAGASAVGISQSEVYEALQRGVLDGTSGASLDIAVDRDYQEVAPHFVDVNSGNYAMTANVINRQLWDSMPSDIQAAITKVSEDYLDDYLARLGDLEVAACDELLEAGGDVTLLPESETQDWAEKAGPQIRNKWAKAVESSAGGADADAFFEEYTSMLESYEAESDYESAMKRCDAQQ
jgi:TRAP-type C4-dicarboxylate transport system substrate-binding protein